MALRAAFPNFYIQWPDNATQTLIERHRALQHEFCSTSIHNQKRHWRTISKDIANNYPTFTPTRKQYRTKWNLLKSGYENLKRLLNGNLEGYPTHTPTLHDERFHEFLSDEFWLVERNYLLFNGIFHLFIAFILINCFILIKRGLAQPEEIDWTRELTHTEKSAGALVPDPDITNAGAMTIILPLPTVTIILLIADRR
jgi:hypothetical protein